MNTIHALNAPNGIHATIPAGERKSELFPPPNSRMKTPPPITFVAEWARLDDQMLPVFKFSHLKMIERNIPVTGKTSRLPISG